MVTSESEAQAQGTINFCHQTHNQSYRSSVVTAPCVTNPLDFRIYEDE